MMTRPEPSPHSSIPGFIVRPLAALKDNYIWLLAGGTSATVVDPGDADPVESALADGDLHLEAILVTHHHADHQGGVRALVERHGVPVYGPAAESITGLARPLRGGERIEIAGLGPVVEVLAVPGHTLGHLAYLVGNRLFCGDTLFGAGCGRLFEGTPEQMAASLARLAALPDDTEVYCAHEYTAMNLRFAAAVEPENPAIRQRMATVTALRERGEPSLPSTIGLEKMTNPFFRCGEPAVVAAARLHAEACGQVIDVADPVAVFAMIRRWRNDF